MMSYLDIFIIFFFFFNDTATTEIYTLSLHDALPISRVDDDERLGVTDPVLAHDLLGDRAQIARGGSQLGVAGVGADPRPLEDLIDHARHSLAARLDAFADGLFALARRAAQEARVHQHRGERVPEIVGEDAGHERTEPRQPFGLGVAALRHRVPRSHGVRAHL